MKELKKYVQDRLKDELKVIRQGYASVLPELSVEEKTLIYWYTDSGSMGLNELLKESKGKKISKLGEYLDIALSKLPNFEGITFRGDNLSSYEIAKYQQALDSEITIIDPTFVSSSRLKNKANEYRRTIMFEIFSKNGKHIEKVSKFVNEQEVLFRRNSQFWVLDIEKRDSYVYIILQEI